MRTFTSEYHIDISKHDFCGGFKLVCCSPQQTDSPSLLARLLAMTTQDASVFSSDDVLLTVALLDAIIVSVSDISMEQVSHSLSHTDIDRISSQWLFSQL